MLLGDLIAAFWTQYPDADKVIYSKLFFTLQETPISHDVGVSLLKDIKRKKDLLALSEIAFRVAQGLVPEEELKLQYTKLDTPIANDDDFPLNVVTSALDELIESSYAAQGYRWRLECLNKSMGSLRPGDFGFIFARPETGKTTFLTSEITHFLTQPIYPERPIIWFNNEEQGNKVMLRVYQAFFGVTTGQLLSNVKKFKQTFIEQTQGRFYLFDDGNITVKNVESIVARLNPGMVIYDQLTKIKGLKADRDDLRLGAIFQWARELAKGSHAAIGVSQADGTAENVRYLTMDHVANVKTAVQAEADWILGIGCVHDNTQEWVRYLNISKNKLLGDPDTDPNLRHGRFETIIEPSIARYKDVISYK